MLHVLWFVIVGFFAGLIARAVLPGADQLGFLLTTAVGLACSLLGGFVGNLIREPEPGSKFHPAGFFMSVLGAVVLLLILRFVR